MQYMTQLETYIPPDKKKKPQQEETMGQRIIRMGLDFLKQQIQKWRNIPTPQSGIESIEHYQKEKRNAKVIKKTWWTKENPYNLPIYEESGKSV